MKSSTITRITTGTLTVLLSGSIAYGVHESNRAGAAVSEADAWRAEAIGWEALAQDAAARNAALAEQNRTVVREYNALADEIGARRTAAAQAATTGSGTTTGTTTSGVGYPPPACGRGETADAPGLGPGGGDPVEVRVLPPASGPVYGGARL